MPFLAFLPTTNLTNRLFRKLIVISAGWWQNIKAAPILAIWGYLAERTTAAESMNNSRSIIKENTSTVVTADINPIVAIDNTALLFRQMLNYC